LTDEVEVKQRWNERVFFKKKTEKKPYLKKDLPTTTNDGREKRKRERE